MARSRTPSERDRVTACRPWRLAPLLALAAFAVAGCAQSVDDYSPAQAPKDIQVQRVSLGHDILFEPGGSVLEPRESMRLDAFLGQLGPRASDRFTVELGRGGGPLDEARLEAVAQRIRRHLPAARVYPAVAVGAPGDAVRLLVGRYVALPPRCPNWSRPSGGNPGNVPDGNFGCANATNLGAMIADPADLLRGRDLAPADGTVMAAGVNRYRAGKVKDPRPETTTGGSESE